MKKQRPRNIKYLSEVSQLAKWQGQSWNPGSQALDALLLKTATIITIIIWCLSDIVWSSLMAALWSRQCIYFHGIDGDTEAQKRSSLSSRSYSKSLAAETRVQRHETSNSDGKEATSISRDSWTFINSIFSGSRVDRLWHKDISLEN